MKVPVSHKQPRLGTARLSCCWTAPSHTARTLPIPLVYTKVTRTRNTWATDKFSPLFSRTEVAGNVRLVDGSTRQQRLCRASQGIAAQHSEAFASQSMVGPTFPFRPFHSLCSAHKGRVLAVQTSPKPASVTFRARARLGQTQWPGPVGLQALGIRPTAEKVMRSLHHRQSRADSIDRS